MPRECPLMTDPQSPPYRSRRGCIIYLNGQVVFPQSEWSWVFRDPRLCINYSLTFDYLLPNSHTWTALFSKSHEAGIEVSKRISPFRPLAYVHIGRDPESHLQAALLQGYSWGGCWLSSQGLVLWGHQRQTQCPGKATLTVGGRTQWTVFPRAAWSIPPRSLWPWLPAPLSPRGAWKSSWRGLAHAERGTFPPQVSPLPMGLTPNPHFDKTSNAKK